MNDGRPRPHDHLVEPIYAGLEAEHEPRPEQAVGEAGRVPTFALAALAVAAALAVRAWMLW